MNLVVITAVIAVASAAKLDRTYLPPPSAKTAGGSPGALQTPFASKSFNNGLGGIPKGGFENDFKGVVVDAAAPGTRASGEGDTGLGAPRIAYGSTNSKVGDDAFRGSPAGFRGFPQQNQFGNQNSQFSNRIPDGTVAGTTVNAQSFAQGPGNFQGSSEQISQRSQELNARDAAANIVKFDSDVGPESFSYSFETDNGISAEESGVATNGVQAQGGFSYTGDDGQVYSVTYTADEGGYQPKGDHLPTPPPIPDEILKSLEQNARDEEAGLVDDGSYDAQKYNAEGDYTENDGASTYNGRQAAQFGNRPESDVSASGTFINQKNQPFVRPNAQDGLTGQGNTGAPNFGSSPHGSLNNGFGQTTSPSSTPNGFGQSALSKPNAFIQTASSPNAPNGFGQPTSITNGANGIKQPTPNAFGQAAVPSNGINGFGQANQAINRFQQNKPSFNSGAEDSENANTFVSPTFETSQNVIQGQNKPQQPSFGRPQPNSQAITGHTSFGIINSNNPFGPSSNNGNAFGQRQSSRQSVNSFGNNEYLPPVNGNRKPAQSTPQRTSSFGATQGFSQFTQTTRKPEDSGASLSLVPSAQSTVESQKPQFGSSQSNQFSNYQKPTGLTTPQSFTATQSNGKPSFGGSKNISPSGQASGTISPFKQQQSTAEPVTELTTPLEDRPNANGNTQSSVFGSFGAQSSQARPTQSPFGSQPKGSPQFTGLASTSTSVFASSVTSQGSSSRPSSSSFAPTSSFLNQRPQSSSQYNQDNRFEQSQESETLSQKQPSDVQFASSTQRPTFSQNTQAQGPDDSYYYNQPSKAFNSPNSPAQVSRFPNTPFNQFDRVTQRPSFQSNAQASVSQQNFPGSSFNQNGQVQGSTRYPQPPNLSSIAPTTPTRGSTAASFNGITQASASSFASSAPTSSTPFGSQSTFSDFGRRPAQQPNGQFNNQGFGQTSSSQQGLKIQTTVNPQSFSNRKQQPNTFQNQQSPNSEDSPAVPSQQYQGEIYEYTKPAQTLPPPTEQDKKEGFGQFGNPAKLQSGQQARPQESSDSQSGKFQDRPQFASTSRPQFGQKTQTSQQTQFSAQTNSRPQFGQQTTSFKNTQSTQTSDAEEYQSSTGDQFNSQANLNVGSQTGQQFSSRPSGRQPSQFNGQVQQAGSQEPCCKRLPSSPQVQPQSNQFRGQSQGQFGSSGITAQDFKLNQDSAQSIAGKGEVFGGPRKPPSFDENTGYHY